MNNNFYSTAWNNCNKIYMCIKLEYVINKIFNLEKFIDVEVGAKLYHVAGRGAQPIMLMLVVSPSYCCYRMKMNKRIYIS